MEGAEDGARMPGGRSRQSEAQVDEGLVTRAILASYHAKLDRSTKADVVVVGAGPAGLTAARELAEQGRRVTVLEKRLAPGGGVWGGAIAMNEVVVQNDALPLLGAMKVRARHHRGGLHVVDAIELASALCLSAIQAGAILLNLIFAEDLCVHRGRVCGVVANRTGVGDALPVDPMVFQARTVLDATGHEAALARMLWTRGLPMALARPTREGPMDAAEGERFVVEEVTEIYPGLWIAGMSVAATLSGPRMGPIFGGMLLSGQRAAEHIHQALDALDRQ
jgi:thiamine thiazole synthase